MNFKRYTFDTYLDGNLIFGQYSYTDPVGNLVIVKYTVDQEGNGYSEKRLLTVNYK